MRKWIGTVCVILGVACLLGAVGFAVYNRWEDEASAQITQSLLEQVQLAMEEDAVATLPQDENVEQDAAQDDPPAEDAKIPTAMATVKVGGEDCIGILSIPVVELELPVLTEWSYAKLKKAPCHYYGAYYEENFVIAAHNYKSQFRRLSELQQGDLVIFTDVSGTAYYYEVVLLETLSPIATEEMITSGFDLTLYTCTPGGGSRVTARCNRKEINP